MFLVIQFSFYLVYLLYGYIKTYIDTELDVDTKREWEGGREREKEREEFPVVSNITNE